jgi:hypothetical protein
MSPRPFPNAPPRYGAPRGEPRQFGSRRLRLPRRGGGYRPVCASGGGAVPPRHGHGGGAPYMRMLPASACCALVSLRPSRGPYPFASMHLRLCSRAPGLSDGLSASNNAQLYACSPLLPLLSFTPTSFKPPS